MTTASAGSSETVRPGPLATNRAGPSNWPRFSSKPCAGPAPIQAGAGADAGVRFDGAWPSVRESARAPSRKGLSVRVTTDMTTSFGGQGHLESTTQTSSPRREAVRASPPAEACQDQKRTNEGSVDAVMLPTTNGWLADEQMPCQAGAGSSSILS